jgi:hypothetical protein
MMSAKRHDLHHKRIAFVLFFHSGFNKFTDRMLEIFGKGHKSIEITDRQWRKADAPEHRLETFI